VFSELARRYQKVRCKQEGLYPTVEVEHKGRSVSVSDFESGWWLELRRPDDPRAVEKAAGTVDEVVTTVRVWLDS